MDNQNSDGVRKSSPDIQVESVGTSMLSKKGKIDADQYIPKPWLKAPGQPFREKCDMCTFKCIFYLPVVITFTIFTFLVAFYCFVSNMMNSVTSSFLLSRVIYILR